MAVNEKVVYATQWTCHGGKVYKPGDRMSGVAPEPAVRAAQEQGLASESHAEAERARKGETERKGSVDQMHRERLENRRVY